MSCVSKAEPRGATPIGRPSALGCASRVASSRRQESPASRWAAASAGCTGSGASRATTCRAVDVVTADGSLVRASATENADLFWGLRGGGGNFGIATAFEFDAHPLGPLVMSVTAMYDPNDAPHILRAWREWGADAADEVTTRAAIWSMPAAPELPPAVHNRQVLIIGGVFAGPADVGEQVLQPLREFATPLADLSGHLPFRAVQSSFDAFFPKGEVSSYWKSIYLDDLTDDAIDFIVKIGSERSSPMTLIHVPLIGGAMNRVAAHRFRLRRPERALHAERRRELDRRR